MPGWVACRATYSKNYRFGYTLAGQQADMVFTSVAGHLLELDFPPPYKSWHGCSPKDLFSAPVHKLVGGGVGAR